MHNQPCHLVPVISCLVLQGLEFLSLQNVGCSVAACKAVEELIPADSKLAGLHLFNNMSGDEGAGHIARLLARCPMADFKMASSRVGAEGGSSLANALMTGEAGARSKTQEVGLLIADHGHHTLKV